VPALEGYFIRDCLRLAPDHARSFARREFNRESRSSSLSRDFAGAPDNRGRNVRDRAANGLTSFSQSSAASNVD